VKENEKYFGMFCFMKWFVQNNWLFDKHVPKSPRYYGILYPKPLKITPLSCLISRNSCCSFSLVLLFVVSWVFVLFMEFLFLKFILPDSLGSFNINYNCWAEILRFSIFIFSINKNLWRKILNLQEYSMCQNENLIN
jgi:hypothetical protein